MSSSSAPAHSSLSQEEKRATSRRTSRASYWKDPEKSRRDVALRVKRYRERKKSSASEVVPADDRLVVSPGSTDSRVLHRSMFPDAAQVPPVSERKPEDYHTDGRPMTYQEIGDRDYDYLWAICDKAREEQEDGWDCEEVEDFLLTGRCQCLGASRECGHAPLLL